MYTHTDGLQRPTLGNNVLVLDHYVIQAGKTQLHPRVQMLGKKSTSNAVQKQSTTTTTQAHVCYEWQRKEEQANRKQPTNTQRAMKCT
tara:strand:- start:43 stop:306 length:264 start_codon:yes stop_codon:yes gene_type:complete